MTRYYICVFCEAGFIQNDTEKFVIEDPKEIEKIEKASGNKGYSTLICTDCIIKHHTDSRNSIDTIFKYKKI